MNIFSASTQSRHCPNAGQMAWYVKKSDTQLEDMKREYPSTPEEAFEATVEGAYYAQPNGHAPS